MNDVNLEQVARSFGRLIPGAGELRVVTREDGTVHACREHPGMVVDGDVLRDVIADAVPRLLADEAAHQIAEAALDGAVRAGMTVLHGPDLKPRVLKAGES